MTVTADDLKDHFKMVEDKGANWQRQVYKLGIKMDTYADDNGITAYQGAEVRAAVGRLLGAIGAANEALNELHKAAAVFEGPRPRTGDGK